MGVDGQPTTASRPTTAEHRPTPGAVGRLLSPVAGRAAPAATQPAGTLYVFPRLFQEVDSWPLTSSVPLAGGGRAPPTLARACDGRGDTATGRDVHRWRSAWADSAISARRSLCSLS
ncbi:hypothetical protein GCM10022402_26740 [Salinactinospora qingdaonensis]|uniref:Uncharacterized protein n=1 Tax=Salinactinospora qingdaonensis TaxID=702744 RepID=A0ABP7FS59_9ACTN